MRGDVPAPIPADADRVRSVANDHRAPVSGSDRRPRRDRDRPLPCVMAARRARSPDSGRKLAVPPKKSHSSVTPVDWRPAPIVTLIKLDQDPGGWGMHPSSAPGGTQRPVSADESRRVSNPFPVPGSGREDERVRGETRCGRPSTWTAPIGDPRTARRDPTFAEQDAISPSPSV
jgi:hypothetical protein